MNARARQLLLRRLERLEGSFGGEARCKCGLPPTVAVLPWTVAIVLVGPGEPADTCCPDCGLGRIVYQVAFDPARVF
jgi:hypothetical protein